VKVDSKHRFAVVLTLAGLVVSGVASAASGPWVSFVDHSYGIRVTIPTSWYTVPPTVAGVQSLIRQLDKQKKTGLAKVYASFISTPAARNKMLSYHFQAFEYSPGSSAEPDFTLAFARTSRAFTVTDLTAISKSLAKAFAARGMTVATSTVVTLPAGPAAFAAGTLPSVGAGSSTHFETYVIAHGTLLYQLSFSADTSILGGTTAFAEIAHRFAFV
jgi:hypothetical protein